MDCLCRTPNVSFFQGSRGGLLKTQPLVFKSGFPYTQAAPGATILGEAFPKDTHCHGLDRASPKFPHGSPIPDIS